MRRAVLTLALATLFGGFLTSGTASACFCHKKKAACAPAPVACEPCAPGPGLHDLRPRPQEVPQLQDAEDETGRLLPPQEGRRGHLRNLLLGPGDLRHRPVDLRRPPGLLHPADPVGPAEVTRIASATGGRSPRRKLRAFVFHPAGLYLGEESNDYPQCKVLLQQRQNGSSKRSLISERRACYNTSLGPPGDSPGGKPGIGATPPSAALHAPQR